MWEQRYGFPEPERTSAGYRVYSEDDVEALRRVLAYRERGLSVPAAVERARSTDLATDRPSLYGVLAAGDPPPPLAAAAQAHADRRLARDRGRDDLARGRAGGGRRLPERAQLPRGRAPLPRDGADRRRRGRVRRLRRAGRGRRRAGRGAARARRRARQRVGGRGRRARLRARACSRGSSRGRARCPTASGASRRSGRSTRAWCAGRRRWRRRSRAGPDRALGDRMDALLDERPLALEQPAPALTAVTNRIVGYLDAG